MIRLLNQAQLESSPWNPRPSEYQPGWKLLSLVKAGFVKQMTTLHAWCNENGIAPQNARVALLGGWTGPKAEDLVGRLVEVSGITEETSNV